MDLKGSLVDTKLKIYPTKALLEFIKKIPNACKTPVNISKLIKGNNNEDHDHDIEDVKQVQLNDKDIINLNTIKEIIQKTESDIEKKYHVNNKENDNISDENNDDKLKKTCKNLLEQSEEGKEKLDKDTNEYKPHVTTLDIDWLYSYIQKLKASGEKDVPYLHTLLQGALIETPDNKVIKRNPVLEARCVKLRAQQEARDYRKMTKSVDNVRMRFPDDTIAYQLKQVNRQLIAVGQLIISIFAGFLFGFKGIEWMIGSLDFGFRLLLGVMCALIITLAEIYFLAKKLNEELNVPETVQLGGPPKFVNEPSFLYEPISKVTDNVNKEHQD